jgi:steroid delta-isomerase-like uncharacterized protein
MNRFSYIVLFVALIIVSTGCADKESQAKLAELKTRTELEARNIELIKTLATEGDKGNMDIFNKVYAPDSKFYFPSNNAKPMSREDEMAMAKAFFAALPDMKHEITDIFAVQDKVVMRFVLHGTQKAELEGIPPTGKRLAVSAISVFRIKDGLVIEEREEADMLGMYQQLGMELKRQAPAAKK